MSPKRSNTHKLYARLRRRGYSEKKAARIAQRKTGRKPKKRG